MDFKRTPNIEKEIAGPLEYSARRGESEESQGNRERVRLVGCLVVGTSAVRGQFIIVTRKRTIQRYI